MIKELKNKEEFQSIIREGITIVDFNATWCGPCKMLKPILEEISVDYNVVGIDIDEFEDITNNYVISSVPTMILFENGQEINRMVGFNSKKNILEWINGKQ